MHCRGANVEWNYRSVGNLQNCDGDLCAVLEGDVDFVTLFMAEKCRSNRRDRAHYFDALFGAFFFDVPNEVRLGTVFVIASKQNGDS